MTPGLTSVEVDLDATDMFLRVRFGGAEVRDFTWRWLRDHGEDAESLDALTGQRRIDTFALDARPDAGSVSVVDGVVVIDWPRGGPTTISTRRLAEVSGVIAVADERRPWTATSPPDSEPAPTFADLVASDEVLAAALDGLRRQGFVVVTGVPDDRDSTARLIDRFGPVRNSIFGAVWSVVAGSPTHADSAYGSAELEPHTDGTYCNDAPGLQVLHFTQTATDGGENVLVDGLAVHGQLAEDEPRLLETLTSVRVPARYVEPGVDLRAERPAIRLDGRGAFLQISFNNYDRAPFWLPPDDIDAFYDAYVGLHDRVVSADNRVMQRVEAGQALVFDNWRLLHGRTAFTGERRYQGGYVSREDWVTRRPSAAST